jgi:hypothetical protein
MTNELINSSGRVSIISAEGYSEYDVWRSFQVLFGGTLIVEVGYSAEKGNRMRIL